MNSLHPRSSLARWIAFAGIALGIPACGGTSEDRVPVYKTTGKITFEGKPVAGALVLFRKPEADPKVPSPSATTEDDGTFQLHTYEPNDGAPAGDYQVGVSIASPRRDGGGGFFSEKKKQAEGPEAVVKGRYAEPKTSGLKATVKPAETTLDPIDLTATGGASPAPPISRGDR